MTEEKKDTNNRATDDPFFTDWQSEAIWLLREIRDLLKTKSQPRSSHKTTKLELPKLAEIWNSYADPTFARVLSVSTASNRYRQAKARWEEKPDEDYWKTVVMRMNQSKFLRGEVKTNRNPWMADFEFFVRPDSHSKVLEGKYDDAYLTKKKSHSVYHGKLADGTEVWS